MSVAILAYCTVFFLLVKVWMFPCISIQSLSGTCQVWICSSWPPGTWKSWEFTRSGTRSSFWKLWRNSALWWVCVWEHPWCLLSVMKLWLCHFTVGHLYTNSDSRQNQNIQQLQPVLYKSYLDCSKINNSWVHCLYLACIFLLKCFCNLILVIRFLFIKEMMVWMCFCCNQISTVTMQSLQPSAINTPLLWSVIFFPILFAVPN